MLRGTADELGKLTKAEQEHAGSVKRTGEAERGLVKDVDDATRAHVRHRQETERAQGATRQMAFDFGDLGRKAKSAGEQLMFHTQAVRNTIVAHRQGVESTGRFAQVTSFLSSQVEKARGAFTGGKGPIDKWRTSLAEAGKEAGNLGEGIIQEVGFALFIKYAQAAVTAVVSLGASLISLISVVGQAGVAFGAGFITALAQAVPVMAVVEAAMQRFKLITEAVQATEARAEESQAERLQAHMARVAATESERNAQFQLGQASRQLEMSTRALDEARRHARREIEDLTAAEKEAVTSAHSAEEAAKRAELALQRKRASGTASATEIAEGETEVASAQERVAASHRQVGRSQEDAERARKRGVEGSTQVVSAANAEVNARHAVAQANSQLARAQEHVALTALTADRNLAKQNELLAKMTATEREAYKAMVVLSKGIQEVTRPIADIVVGGFVKMFGRINELLHNQQIIGGLTRIAEAVSHGINKVFDSLTRGPGLKLVIALINDAGKNVERLAGMFSKLIPAILGIAHAATPFFNLFLTKLEKSLEVFDKWVTSAEGNKALTAFFNEAAKSAESLLGFIGSIFHWFASMPSAAEAGRKMLDNWSKSLDKLSEWNKTHGAELTKLFENSRLAVEQMLSVVGALIKEMTKSVDFPMIKTLTGLIKEVLIPALGEAIRVFGKLSFIAHAFLNIPVIREIARWVLAFGLLTVGFGKIYEAVSKLKGLVVVLFGLLKTNPFAWLALGVTAGVELYKHWKLFKEVIDAIWEGLKAVGGTIGKAFDNLGPFKEAAEIAAAMAGSVAIIKSGLGQKIVGKFKDFLHGMFGGSSTLGTTANPMRVIVENMPIGGPGGRGGPGGGPTIFPPGSTSTVAREGEKRLGWFSRVLSHVPVIGPRIAEAGGIYSALRGAPVIGKVLGLGETAAGAVGASKVGGLLGKVGSLGKFAKLGGGLAGIAALIGGEYLANAIGGKAGNVLGGTLEGAGLGATAGAGLGLLGGPFAPLTSTAGAIGGGVVGGAIGLGKGLFDAFGGGGDSPEAKVQKFNQRVQDLQKNFTKLSSGEIRKVHDEAVKMADDPQFSKWIAPLEKIAKFFTPGHQSLVDSLNKIPAQLRGVAEAGGKSLGELQLSVSIARKSIEIDYPKGSEAAAAATGALFQQTTASVVESINQNKISASQGLHVIEGFYQTTMKNIGTDSEVARESISSSFWGAANSIKAAIHAGVVDSHKGLDSIVKLLTDTLGKLGYNKTQISQLTGLAAQGEFARVESVLRPGGSKQLYGTIGAKLHSRETGGYVKAKPGGEHTIVGEGGHDEVILTTDPRQAKTQRNLLQRFLSNAQHLLPHFAQGGHVAGNRGGPVYQSPLGPGLLLGRTDQGVDASGRGPLVAIGDAVMTRVSPQGSGTGWPGAAGADSGAILVYKLLAGPDKDRFVYAAENIDPVGGLHTGSVVHKGQQIAHARGFYPFLETGWAANAMGETLAHATTGYKEGQETIAGKSFLSFVSGLAQGRILGGVGGGLPFKLPAWHGGGGLMGAIGRAAQVATFVGARKLVRRLEAEKEPAEGAAATGGKAAGNAQMKAWARAGLIAAGLQGTPNEVGTIVYTMQRESGGNPRSENRYDINFQQGHPSRGLMELIPENFKQYHVPGTSMNVFDPVANVAAAVRYMIGRYGHIVGMSPYEEGGDIRARPGGHLAVVGEGGYDEVILTADPAKAARQRGLLGKFLAAAPHVLKAARGRYVSSDTPEPAFQDPLAAYPVGSGVVPHGWQGNVRIRATIEAALRLVEQTVQRGLDTYLKSVAGLRIGTKTTDTQITAKVAVVESEFEGFQTQMNKLAPALAAWGNRLRYTFQHGIAKFTKTGADVVKSAEVSLKELEVQYHDWAGAEKGIAHSIKEVERVIKHGNAKQKAAARGSLGKLREQQENAQEQQSELLAQMAQQQEAVTQARVDAANKEASLQQSALSAAPAAIELIRGKLGGPGMQAIQSQLDLQTQHIMENQFQKLGTALTEAEGAGNTQLANQIREQLNTLAVNISQTAVKRVTDAVAATEQRAQAQLGILQAGQGMAPVLEQRGFFAQAAELTRSSLQSQNAVLGGERGELVGEQKEALGLGNVQLAQELQAKIEGLTVQMAQNDQGIREATDKQVTAMQSLEHSITQLSESTAAGGVAYLQKYMETYHVNTIPAQLELLKTNQETLGKERGTENEGLAGLVGVGGGTISGMLNRLQIAQGPEVFKQIQAILGSESFKLLEPSDKTALQSVFTALEGNTTATLDNTHSILDLEGKLTQIQTFTTSEWSKFRTAILNGMGQIVPTLQHALKAVPAATKSFAMGGWVPSDGMIRAHEGEYVVPRHGALVTPRGGDTTVNVEVNNTKEVPDPIVLGRSVAFAMKTPGN